MLFTPDLSWTDLAQKYCHIYFNSVSRGGDEGWLRIGWFVTVEIIIIFLEIISFGLIILFANMNAQEYISYIRPMYSIGPI